MKYVDASLKLSPCRQFCCPVSLIFASTSANTPVSPRFFPEFDGRCLTARHFEKSLSPSSTLPFETYCFSNSSLAGKSKKLFPFPQQNLIRIANFNPLHDDLPYMQVRRAIFLRARNHKPGKDSAPSLW